MNTSECRALIVYQKPQLFNSVERAILQHGTPDEAARCVYRAAIRSLRIPGELTFGNYNYSSAKMSADLFYRTLNHRKADNS